MTIDTGPLESRYVVEWDWIYFGPRFAVLHAPAKWDDPDYHASDPDARTLCGYIGWGYIPGFLSRLSVPRCGHCCRITGMPRGDGSPKNDNACRPIVKRRLAALGLERATD